MGAVLDEMLFLGTPGRGRWSGTSGLRLWIGPVTVFDLDLFGRGALRDRIGMS